MAFETVVSVWSFERCNFRMQHSRTCSGNNARHVCVIAQVCPVKPPATQTRNNDNNVYLPLPAAHRMLTNKTTNTSHTQNELSSKDSRTRSTKSARQESSSSAPNSSVAHLDIAWGADGSTRGVLRNASLVETEAIRLPPRDAPRQLSPLLLSTIARGAHHLRLEDDKEQAQPR